MTLKEYLALPGNSIPALAEMLGVTQEAVRTWLRGDRKPTFDRLEEIARVTNGTVMPNDFLADQPHFSSGGEMQR